LPSIALFEFAVGFGENLSPLVEPNPEDGYRYHSGCSLMRDLERIARDSGGHGSVNEREPLMRTTGHMMGGGPIRQHLATLVVSLEEQSALAFLAAARPVISDYLTTGGQLVFTYGDLSIRCGGEQCVEQIVEHLKESQAGSIAGAPVPIIAGNLPVDVAPPELDGSDKKLQEHAEGPTSPEVWYATNRERIGAAASTINFSNRIDPDGKVYYGKCLVDIPKTHQFGSLGTQWWKRWSDFRFKDDHLKLQRIDCFLDGNQFFNALRADLTALDEAERQILIYLHGYNVTFDEAAIRAAQMGADLKITGATAFFSWASHGTLGSYVADGDRIAASEKAIGQFLVAIANQAGANKAHIIAHSMGNRGLARAMQRILAEASAHSGLRFGHIILAAPDIEVSLFRQLAAIYPLYCERATMYVSARDRALGISKWLQDSDRAGYTPPITVVPGIDTIEVTDMDLTLLGHGYYAEADGVIRDMFDLLQFNAPPDKRPRTRPVSISGQNYWVIAR
jgi:esterase/lipase superfamily enzyme